MNPELLKALVQIGIIFAQQLNMTQEEYVEYVKSEWSNFLANAPSTLPKVGG